MKKCKRINITKQLTFLDEVKLNTLANEHRLLYNKTLELLKKSEKIDFRELNQLSKNFRNDNELTIPAKSAQNTCRTLISNMKSFFSLRKKDKTMKLPCHFKSWREFQTFQYDWNSGGGGYKFRNGKIEIVYGKQVFLSFKLPKWCNDIETPLTVTFNKSHGKYWLNISYEKQPKEQVSGTKWLAIDPGQTNIATGVAEDGESFFIETKKFTLLEKRIDSLNSKMSKKEKYSKRWKKLQEKKQKESHKLSNKNKDFQHKASRKIVKWCKEKNISKVIYGDIQTKSLPKAKDANRKLNRGSQNRGTLSRFKSFLAYKVEEEGMIFSLQNEAYTSKTNCFTDELMPDMDLSVRKVELVPELVILRDQNGAINIAKKNLGSWSPQLEWLKTIPEKLMHLMSE